MAQDDIQHDTEALRQRLVHELADAPQGHRDSEYPMPHDPDFKGEVGPSPGDNTIPAGDPALAGDKPLTQTGEEPDPAVFQAGGVDAPNTDGMSRTEAHGD